MKKIILIGALAGLLVLPAAGLAVEVKCSEYTAQDTCNLNGCNWDPLNSKCSGVLLRGPSDIMNIINTVGNWVFVILLAVASIFLIVAGFMWVTAGGNPEGVNKARIMLINALVGVGIALIARGLITVIKSVLGA